MRKGFTLVELSIVLVIIGLLIGGILVAQSMIETAKIQSMVRKLQQYEIAISNFKTNYKYEPGDSPYFTPAGNGSGWLDGPGCSSSYSGEGNQQFAHLSESGMLQENYTAWQPTNCGGTDDRWLYNTPGKNLPLFSQASGVKAYFQVVATANSFILTSNGSYLNIYHQPNNPREYQSFVSPIEMLAIDTKMDNGNLSDGLVTGIMQYSTTGASNCSVSSLTKADIDGMTCVFRWYPDGQ